MINEDYKNKLLRNFDPLVYLNFNQDVRKSIGYNLPLAEKHYLEKTLDSVK